MRDYTIYKDSKGKIFASFDDMIEEYPIRGAIGKLKPIKHGKGNFQDMVNERNKMIVREG